VFTVIITHLTITSPSEHWEQDTIISSCNSDVYY
jgi:hypothetical protein